MAKCGGLMVAELVASRGRVVLKTLAQSRGLLVSVAVGRWWQLGPGSWQLVAGWRMAWSWDRLVFVAISTGVWHTKKERSIMKRSLCVHYVLVLWKMWKRVGIYNIGFVHINLPLTQYLVSLYQSSFGWLINVVEASKGWKSFKCFTVPTLLQHFSNMQVEDRIHPCLFTLNQSVSVLFTSTQQTTSSHNINFTGNLY